jgi:Fe-S cluster assembly protein SufD
MPISPERLREMNVAIMKTKAEQALSEQFERVAPKLPGSAAVKALRAAAIGAFSGLGLPHRRVEEYKYTDLRAAIKDALPPAVATDASITAADVIVALGPLVHVDAHKVVFVNGHYRAELSDAGALKGVDIAALSSTIATAADSIAEKLLALSKSDAVSALNTALVTDGAIVRVSKKAKLTKPVLIAHVRAGATAELTTVRNTISVDDGATATIIEAHVTVPGAARDAQINALTEVSTGTKSELHLSKVAVDDSKAIHLSTTNLTIGAESNVFAFQYTAGQAVARNQINVVYWGEGAKLDLSGAFLIRGTSHVDTTLVVDHAVPHCESRELFKGVLDDQARGVFQGKVIVQPDAQKTDGKMMAQALMLSPDTEFDSKPELEIYADDVVCGHGTTTAELDEDLLFYCMSRGIPKIEARALLIDSFIGEAIDKVQHDDLRAALTTYAEAWLRK